jgi:hypothetical protein
MFGHEGAQKARAMIFGEWWYDDNARLPQEFYDWVDDAQEPTPELDDTEGWHGRLPQELYEWAEDSRDLKPDSVIIMAMEEEGDAWFFEDLGEDCENGCRPWVKAWNKTIKNLTGFAAFERILREDFGLSVHISRHFITRSVNEHFHRFGSANAAPMLKLYKLLSLYRFLRQQLITLIQSITLTHVQ